MKVIFLDHQGVMCITDITQNARVPIHDKSKFLELATFDTQNVSFLNKLLSVSNDIEIVVSSDWKNRFTLTELCTLYNEYNINKVPIDCTPFVSYAQYSVSNYAHARSLEIKTWLENNKGKEDKGKRENKENKESISDWIVIDDLDMREYFDQNNFIHITDPKIGLMMLDLEKVLQYNFFKSL